MARQAAHDSPVAAVVVNFNGGERTLRCVEALLGQTRVPDEIIVVDNASRDGSADAIEARFPQVRVLRQDRNLGLSKARNIGLRAAQAAVVLSIDSDVYLRGDALAALLAARAATGAAVVCPRIVLYPETAVTQCEGADPHFTATLTLRNAYSESAVQAAEPTRVGGAIGACLLLDRHATLEAGAFNELYFFYHEDLEFSLRMRALGNDVVYAPAAVVDHDRGTGTPGLSFRGEGEYPARRAYLSMRNRLITIATLYSGRSLLVLAPALLLFELGTLGMALQRGWLPELWRAWSDVVGQRREIRRYRAFVRERRVRCDRELFTADALAFGTGVMQAATERMIARGLAAAMRVYWRLARPLLAS